MSTATQSPHHDFISPNKLCPKGRVQACPPPDPTGSHRHASQHVVARERANRNTLRERANQITPRERANRITLRERASRITDHLMTFPCETPRDGAAALFALSLQNQLPTLATDRLLLRAPRVTDFDAYAQIACTERSKHIGGPMTREDAWADFSQMTSTWILHGHGLWTIGHSGSIAGFIILGFEPGDQEPELGFMLTDTAEGTGIGYEAGKAALGHAWDTLGWTTLVSYIDAGNTRSIRLARRLGALPDGEITDGTDTARVYRYVRGHA